ncbi:F-box/LRR-repeat protein 2-like [Aphidius gifuensis]|nr:F-box/LRR-repeat protein 2-like [Aphidius gifuensis]
MTSLKTIILHNYLIEKYKINENEFMTCIPIGIENIGIIKSKKKYRRACTPIFNCDFSRFTKLCKLRLDNWILSNNTMNSLEKFNETLTDLSLIDCIILKSGQATIPKLTNLENLDLLRVNIDDNVMINITHNCTKLYHLNISNCRKLTRTSLTTLKILRNLKELFVNYLPNIDDAVIKTISNLRIFKCKGCKLITDYGVEKIVKKSPNLEELCITDTGISSKTISYPFKIRKVNIKVIPEDQQK